MVLRGKDGSHSNFMELTIRGQFQQPYVAKPKCIVIILWCHLVSTSKLLQILPVNTTRSDGQLLRCTLSTLCFQKVHHQTSGARAAHKMMAKLTSGEHKSHQPYVASPKALVIILQRHSVSPSKFYSKFYQYTQLEVMFNFYDVH